MARNDKWARPEFGAVLFLNFGIFLPSRCGRARNDSHLPPPIQLTFLGVKLRLKKTGARRGTVPATRGDCHM
ncbi:MAG TPA: hypothetical protein VGI09_01170, partial [Pseudolabrys sp.]